MEILSKVRAWAGELANLGLSLAALAIILEILGMGSMPFMPGEMSVITNVSNIMEALGNQGVIGLIAVWILYEIWQKRGAQEKIMINWIKGRISERTSWDGAVCVALGLMILFMAPLAKIAAGLAIAWGLWTIWKSESD